MLIHQSTSNEMKPRTYGINQENTLIPHVWYHRLSITSPPHRDTFTRNSQTPASLQEKTPSDLIRKLRTALSPITQDIFHFFVVKSVSKSDAAPLSVPPQVHESFARLPQAHAAPPTLAFSVSLREQVHSPAGRWSGTVICQHGPRRR